MPLWITSSASFYLAKKQKTVLRGYADPMHLFIKASIFHYYWPNFGPRFWDIFSISGNALMNHFFSIVLSCEKAKNGSVRLCGSDAPFHQTFNFSYYYWPNFGPRFWDIFSISGNALMNHFFSIVISCEKAKNGSVRVCGSDAPFIKYSIFHNFWPNLGPDLRYFLNFRKCAYEYLLQHRNILRKSEKRLCEVLRIRCTFSSNIQFFIIFGTNLGPDFVDIFSISGNALMNLLLQHRNILRKSEIRLGEVLRIRCTFSSKIQFFILFLAQS